MDKIDELIERYTGGGRCFLQPESKKHFAEDLRGLLANAIAERDARIKELEERYDFTAYLLKRSTEEGVISESLRENQTLMSRIKELEAERNAFESALGGEIEDHKATQAELSRIKEGAKKLPRIGAGEYKDGVLTRVLLAILVSDLDRLMKGGE